MKYIIVPKTPEAQKRLDFDEASGEELIEICLDEQRFDLLWNSQLFSELNRTLGVSIDDYEDEHIVGKDQLERALRVTESFAERYQHQLFSDVNEMIRAAITYDTGIHFYF